jgi:predicted ATPase
MAKKKKTRPQRGSGIGFRPARRGRDAVTRVIVSGYKSIASKQELQIGPITVLAGPNSSGKSSMFQPLLLLKQTLEATYDPGPLLINGPNVKFTSTDQLFTRCSSDATEELLDIGIEVHGSSTVHTQFVRENKKLAIGEMRVTGQGAEQRLRLGMSDETIAQILPKPDVRVFRDAFGVQGSQLRWTVTRNRCFLEVTLTSGEQEFMFVRHTPAETVIPHIRGLIHLPGLRGNPERSYPVSAVGDTFPGTFDKYVASVIAKWEAEGQEDSLVRVGSYLEMLGLTWKVATEALDETQVQVKVGRLPHAGPEPDDLVNIADVGVGMSQALPIVVALVVARPGQLVYIEQPEIHLHPGAQTRLAEVFADAARRGVRVVVETHSSLLLLAIQTAVAAGKVAPSDVKLHWFARDELGRTRVAFGELDDRGAFGSWPEDFGAVVMDAETAYIEAAAERLDEGAV